MYSFMYSKMLFCSQFNICTILLIFFFPLQNSTTTQQQTTQPSAQGKHLSSKLIFWQPITQHFELKSWSIVCFQGSLNQTILNCKLIGKSAWQKTQTCMYMYSMGDCCASKSLPKCNTLQGRWLQFYIIVTWNRKCNIF